MSYQAWAYIWGVLLAGALATIYSFANITLHDFQWPAFVTLTAFATLAHLFEAQAHGRHSYYPSYVFFFAGVLLLHPALLAVLVATPHIIELVKDRIVSSDLRRAWYVQPFNIAMHIVAGFMARLIYSGLHDGAVALFLPQQAMIAVTSAALAYVVINNFLLGAALVLARGISWRESGVLDLENLLSELILLCLGYVVAILWQLNPWFILPAISPLALMYRALTVPRLKQEAQIDAKTGLANARHFGKLLNDEFNRAQRFNRPLAFVMADLDFMRNINNNYGHLAGDAVLARIGHIIRTTVRDYDVAGRFGGEEFALALPEMDLPRARELAERLRMAIEAADFVVPTSDAPIHVTMSMGVACFPSDATTPTALIHEADVAVYAAKANGRNQVVCAADVPPATKIKHLPKTEQPKGTVEAEPHSQCDSLTVEREDMARLVASNGDRGSGSSSMALNVLASRYRR